MYMSDNTLLSILRRLAEHEPDKRLLGSGERWISTSEALKSIESMGRKLVQLGLRPGELAALRAERCPETALLILALRAAGAVVVLTSPRQEIDISLAECDAVICPRVRIERDSGESLRVLIDGRSVTLLPGTGEADAELPETTAKSAAFIIFTSGSTGKSKAVVLSENNFISNLLDSRPLGMYAEDDIALGSLPLEHVFGLALLVGAIVHGYGVYFPEKTDIQSLLNCIEKEKITRMNGVPSLYLSLAEKRGGFDLSSLRAGFIGGGPITSAQFIMIEKELGITLIPVYGMSECVGISCASYRDPQSERSSGVGHIYSMNTVRILSDDGSEAGPGQEGEIYVRGPMRMLGYYGRHLPEDEFLATGDLGFLDESGVLHLTGRKKEIIIRNGNNLSARRIENALLSQPDVRAAVVMGLPDERQGEVPYAMIVGKADMTALGSLLNKNELPEGILSVEALPMTESGKPDRQKIREVLLSWRSL